MASSARSSLLVAMLAVACPFLWAAGAACPAAGLLLAHRPLAPARGCSADGSAAAAACGVLRLRGGAKKSFGRRFGGSSSQRRGGGNDAHMQSIDIEKFKEDVGAGRKLSRDRRRDAELQKWLRDKPYERPYEEQHPITSSLHPINRMAALRRMEKLKKKIERRGKGTRRRLAMAKREAQKEQRARARAAKVRADNDHGGQRM